MQTIYSDLFRLNKSDFIKGIVVAGLVALLGAIQQGVMAHGLSFSAYDWWGIWDVSWKASFAYLSKNFLSDSNGKIFGAIG